MFESMMKSPTELLDTLRLTPRQAEELLDSLTQGEHAQAPTVERRRGARLFFTDLGGVALEASHPGGSLERYQVIPADLSERGMRALHGGFLHAGTSVVVSLRDLSGLTRRLPGWVVRCDHHAGRVHVLGVSFDERIRLADFLRAEDAVPTTLAGQVLHVDDSEDFRRIFAYQCEKLGPTVVGARSVDEGVTLVNSSPFGVVFVDLHLGRRDGLEAIEKLREAGYTGPIVMLTGDENPEVPARAKGAGASEVLVKPVSAETLRSSLSRHLLGGADGEPIVSRLWDDAQARPIVEKLCEGLSDRVSTLEGMLRGETSGWRDACRDLKSEAAEFGYPELAEAFRTIERMEQLDQGVIEDELARLRQLIGRMQMGLTTG